MGNSVSEVIAEASDYLTGEALRCSAFMNLVLWLSRSRVYSAGELFLLVLVGLARVALTESWLAG